MTGPITWKHYLALAAVLLAAACPVCCWGPARADEPARVDAAQALRVLCPKRLDLAPHFNRAAKRYHVPASLLVAMARAESTCQPGAVGKLGERGLMQIKPGTWAARGVQVDYLDRPEVSTHLGARHITFCLALCGDFAGALGVYSGRRTCKQGRASGYARRVLGFWEQVKGEPRS